MIMKPTKLVFIYSVAAAVLLCSCGKPIITDEPQVTENSVIETVTETKPPVTETEPESSAEPLPDPSVRIVCAGDNLIHSSLYKQANRRAGGDGYDFDFVYEKVVKYIEPADLAILNQETLVTDKFEPSDYPRFCTPEDLGKKMIDMGFDAFSISNNHILDKNEEGLLATLDFWDSQKGIISYGAYRDKEDMDNIRTLEINGITFAFLGYTEHTNGLSLPASSECEIVYLSELDTIKEQIQRADELADVVIVSPHFGIETTNIVTDQQKDLTRKFVEWGADLIIGTQPHTVQTMEFIDKPDGGKAFVYYCLGNFVSAQNTELTLVGIIGDLTVTKSLETGEITFSEVKAIPIITQYGYNYSNIHIVPYAEYSPELAASHGSGCLSIDSIERVLSNVPDEFLSIE